ncbi:hypothetical protein K503DRAFT_858517 [Rhizopogon vinicolor AM-OR11-026]|uniref:Uncharacterized protein n=1 Tax=Rhizopogon vinicolor AM-OR11-026 TaxID=1314800 RepID=A0A1B7MSK5_9AGAM|nr:hypothetical protein K503DRAFT_858517 [Rhizopogon vinicolor AM-OR11-026]
MASAPRACIKVTHLIAPRSAEERDGTRGHSGRCRPYRVSMDCSRCVNWNWALFPPCATNRRLMLRILDSTHALTGDTCKTPTSSVSLVQSLTRFMAWPPRACIKITQFSLRASWSGMAVTVIHVGTLEGSGSSAGSGVASSKPRLSARTAYTLISGLDPGSDDHKMLTPSISRCPDSWLGHRVPASRSPNSRSGASWGANWDERAWRSLSSMSGLWRARDVGLCSLFGTDDARLLAHRVGSRSQGV